MDDHLALDDGGYGEQSIPTHTTAEEQLFEVRELLQFRSSDTISRKLNSQFPALIIGKRSEETKPQIGAPFLCGKDLPE